MTLYHGSYVVVRKPDAAYGRKEKVNHQICIHNQEIVDRFLRFQSSQEANHA